MKSFSFFFLFGFALLTGCNNKMPLQQARISFEPKNSEDYSSITYRDRFGDGQTVLLKNNHLDTVIKEFLPTTIILRGNGRITPNYLKPNDNFVLSTNSNRQLIEKNENACSAIFEFNEEKLSAPFFESELNWDGNNYDTNKDGFHKNSFGYARLKSRKIALNKALTRLKQLNDTCQVPPADKKRFKSQLDAWYYAYLVSDIINAQPDSLKEPHVVEALNTLDRKILTLYDAKKGLLFNEQRLVYSYNVFLSRDAINTSDELKTQWNNAARFNEQGRDFIRLRLLKKYLYRYTPDYDAFFDEFHKSTKNKSYIVYADDMKNSFRPELNASELNTVMRDTAGKKYALQQIIDAHKNKVIYLTIWNVWGDYFGWGEKQEQIDVLNRAKQLNAVPIFLSANHELNLWKMAVDSTPLGNNPAYNIEVNSPLFKYLNQGYAFHSVMIKDGKVVEFFAPSPDNKEALLRKIELIAKGK